ncbi:hypothetical protein EXE41_17530 [Halorubrum sp. SD690R]|nr:hypothetical protein EXE41_17530 [Halorubrum sp. SD690R]
MARSESGSDWREESMSDAELEAFEDAVGDLDDRVSEFLAEGSDLSAEEINDDVEDLPMPDPLDDRAAEE